MKMDTLAEYKKWYSKLSSRLGSMLLIEDEMRKSDKGFRDKDIKDEATLVIKLIGQIHAMQENQELDSFRDKGAG